MRSACGNFAAENPRFFKPPGRRGRSFSDYNAVINFTQVLHYKSKCCIIVKRRSQTTFYPYKKHERWNLCHLP